jgi:tRNA A58 N-methylase Trm61
MALGRGGADHASELEHVVINELCRAVLAIDHAVRALRQGAVAAAFLAALDQAHTAVHQLPRGLTEQVLSGLLYEIEECRRRGCRDSPRLQMHIRIAKSAILAEVEARQPARLGRPAVSTDD